MARSNKFKTNKLDSNVNAFLLLLLFIASIGTSWLAFKKVTGGSLYTTLFLVSVVMVLVTFFFIKENNLKNFINLPFAIDYDLGIASFYIGLTIPLLLKFILSFVGYTPTAFFIPLSTSEGTTQQILSFSTAETAAAPFWAWFTEVFTAGVYEEFIFGFALVVVSYVAAMVIVKLIKAKSSSAILGEEGLLGFSPPNTYLAISLFITVSLFMGGHLLNSTYITIWMFAIAALFRLVMNLAIYKFGLFLSFTIGYHIMNNNIYFVEVNGFETFLQAMISFPGIITGGAFLLGILYLLRRVDTVTNKFGNYIDNLGNID